MNATRIIDVLKRAYLPHIKPLLGRWNIHNHSETALKIKYATEDNCGISFHNYKNTIQIEEIQQPKPKKYDSDDEEIIDELYINGFPIEDCKHFISKIILQRVKHNKSFFLENRTLFVD